MSKLSPLSQSMAALFTPESERARKSQSDRGSTVAGTPRGSFRVPGSGALAENARSGDSLGNPASPGYERLDLNKKAAEQQPGADQTVRNAEAFPAKPPGPELIRLESGFEELLLEQGKLCGKATALYRRLDAPKVYRRQRKGRLLNGKSRGCIVDVDVQEIAAAPLKKPDDAA